jgi:hypothetical protein
MKGRYKKIFLIEHNCMSKRFCSFEEDMKPILTYHDAKIIFKKRLD